MIKQAYTPKGDKGLFYEQFNIEWLSINGNPLEKIGNVNDVETFRRALESRF